MELRGLLKEQKSAECKEKESTDVSGNSSDGQAELKKSLETQQAATKEDPKVTKLSKERGKKNLKEMSDGENPVTNVSTADEMDRPGIQCPSHSKSLKQHATRHRVCVIL